MAPGDGERSALNGGRRCARVVPHSTRVVHLCDVSPELWAVSSALRSHWTDRALLAAQSLCRTPHSAKSKGMHQQQRRRRSDREAVNEQGQADDGIMMALGERGREGERTDRESAIDDSELTEKVPIEERLLLQAGRRSRSRRVRLDHSLPVHLHLPGPCTCLFLRCLLALLPLHLCSPLLFL